MKKKILFVLPAIALVLAGAGCEYESTPSTPTTSYSSEANTVEETQQTLVDATPIPELTRSVERENIVRRAETFDVQNKVSYIYLISYGKVMAFYSVEGKVSSLNSYITPMEKIVDSEGRFPCNAAWRTNWVEPCYVIQSPDIDGAYGENADGIFFFTTDGAYVEWNGEYMMSDFPLQLSTPPALVRQIDG